MRTYLQVWKTDGNVDVFGPFDGTSPQSIPNSCYWARTFARAGGVKNVYVMEGGTALHCYRSKPNGGYQKARKIVLIGASFFPRW